MSQTNQDYGDECAGPVRLPAATENWFECIPAMIHSINTEGLIIFVSDDWLKKLGYSRAEVIGTPFVDFLTPVSRERAIQDIVPAFFRNWHSENVEYQMAAKDGRILDVILTSTLFSNPGTEAESWSISVARDVTELKATRQRLIESETMYRTLIEDQPEFVSLLNPDGTYKFVNNATARLLGKTPAELTGLYSYDFLAPAHRDAAHARIDALRNGTPVVTGESQLKISETGTRWISWTHRAIFDADGNISAIHSVGRDVEERMAHEKRLRESEARYRLLANNNTDMVVQIGRRQSYEYVSPACRDMLGYEPEEITGARIIELAHPDDSGLISECLQSLLEGQSQRQQITGRFQHRDGHWVWCEGRFQAIVDQETGSITGLTGAIRNISARKAIEDQLAEANQRLAALATTDDLTGLNNRRGFDPYLSREYRRAKRDKSPQSLIMIDVDSFKLFNDRYGHLAGDDCLRRIGECVKSAIRRPGDIAVRYGGEEFAILLPNTSEEGALIFAERIRHDILQLAIPHADRPQLAVTISAGVATVGPKTFDPDPSVLIAHADQALYNAKAGNRNRCVGASQPLAIQTPSAA